MAVLIVVKCEMLVWRLEASGLKQLPRNDTSLPNPVDYFCGFSTQSGNLLRWPEWLTAQQHAFSLKGFSSQSFRFAVLRTHMLWEESVKNYEPRVPLQRILESIKGFCPLKIEGSTCILLSRPGIFAHI